MIVCSCNVFSDHQVRSVVTKEARRPRMSEVYACLGCSAQCGRCAHTIKRIMDEKPSCANWLCSCERKHALINSERHIS
jgi:bacterioferritin-associated ferredoxin